MIYPMWLCVPGKKHAGKDREGMAAVVCVLFNRARAWGKSLHDTVYQRNQFTSMSVPSV